MLPRPFLQDQDQDIPGVVAKHLRTKIQTRGQQHWEKAQKWKEEEEEDDDDDDKLDPMRPSAEISPNKTTGASYSVV